MLIGSFFLFCSSSQKFVMLIALFANSVISEGDLHAKDRVRYISISTGFWISLLIGVICFFFRRHLPASSLSHSLASSECLAWRLRLRQRLRQRLLRYAIVDGRQCLSNTEDIQRERERVQRHNGTFNLDKRQGHIDHDTVHTPTWGKSIT